MDLPDYVQPVPARNPRYFYFRRGGFRVTLPDPRKDPEGFRLAYGKALAKSAKVDRPSPNTTIRRGSVAWWAQQYQKTPEWEKLAPRTRDIYLGFLGHLIARHGTKPLSELTEARVWKLRDTEPGPVSRVNGILKVLSQLCNMAVHRDELRANPVKHVKPRPLSGTGFKVWPEPLVEQYQGHHARGTIPRAMFDLALYAAQRRSDVSKMQWDDITAEGLFVEQQKTGRVLVIPLHPDLIDTLEATPKVGPFIVGTGAGRQRSAKAMGNYFRQACDAAGIPEGYAMHGLRKTAAVRLVEAGVSVDDACAITGHSNPNMLRHYAASAEQKVKAQRAMKQLLAAKGL